MFVNDKSDIPSDILRSFQNNIIVRCQESNDLDELASQHPGKECQSSQNDQTCKTKKNAKIGGFEKRETNSTTSRPATDTVLVLSNQCIFYEDRRDK